MLFAHNLSRSSRTQHQLLRLLAGSHKQQQAAAAVALGHELDGSRGYATDANTQYNGSELVADADAEEQLIGYDAAAASRPLRVHQVIEGVHSANASSTLGHSNR